MNKSLILWFTHSEWTYTDNTIHLTNCAKLLAMTMLQSVNDCNQFMPDGNVFQWAPIVMGFIVCYYQMVLKSFCHCFFPHAAALGLGDGGHSVHVTQCSELCVSKVSLMQ